VREQEREVSSIPKYRGTDTVWARATTSAFTTVATIPNLREVSPGLGGTLAQFDQSAYGDVWMDFGAGQKEGDEVQFTMAYDPADVVHTNLRTDADAGSTMWIRASHALSDFRWNCTFTGIGSRVAPLRDGSLELHIMAKIVSPGVVQETIP
jgi:hypothetical protein